MARAQLRTSTRQANEIGPSPLRAWVLSTPLVLVASLACTRENPAFDPPTDTDALDTSDSVDEGDPSTTAVPDTGEGPLECGIEGGVDMSIKVPQPCGETNDVLGTYEHWFHVVEAAGSTWQVQFCTADCGECEPLAAGLTFAPLPVADLAGPGTCLRMAARRLGAGDDCDYQAATVQDMTNNGEVLIVARRTELLEIPELGTNTGLLGFAPSLWLDEACDCGEVPEACCGSQAPSLYGFDVGGTQIPVGETQPVTLGGRSYEFWAFDAFQSGDCGAETRVVWALTKY